MILRLARRPRSGTGFKRDSARRVPCRRLSGWMQRLEERDKRSGLRGAKILAVRGHVAAALNHLTNQLILCQPHGHSVERWSALSALIVERMAVVALLHLENKRTLPLESRAIVKKLGRNRNSAPC